MRGRLWRQTKRPGCLMASGNTSRNLLVPWSPTGRLRCLSNYLRSDDQVLKNVSARNLGRGSIYTINQNILRLRGRHNFVTENSEPVLSELATLYNCCG